MDGKFVRVVLVDDENHFRLLMKRIVLSLGYRIVGEASHGIDALKLYEKEKPDLMLLDINMPFKEGNEVLAEILKKDKDACVIMMTSVTDSDIIRECITMGAANYILKCNPMKEIGARIKETYTKFSQKRKAADIRNQQYQDYNRKFYMERIHG